MSVVQMARAVVSQASWDESRLACAVGMQSRILPIGSLGTSDQYTQRGQNLERRGAYRCPMTPVLMTSELSC